jgi:hypothetical protein
MRSPDLDPDARRDAYNDLREMLLNGRADQPPPEPST